MSMDRSLRRANALVRHRNVLSRAERIEQLKEQEKWVEDRSVFGLPKIAHRKVGGKSKPAKAEAEAAAVAGAAPVEGAPAAPAAPAEPAKPAKAGKAAKGGKEDKGPKKDRK